MALFLNCEEKGVFQEAKKEIDSLPTKPEANFRQLTSAER